MPGIPGALAKRRGQDAILDQREADRTHALELPEYGLDYDASAHVYGVRNAATVALTNQLLYLAPCRPPAKIVIPDKVRVSVILVAGAPVLSVALFRYDRTEKLLRQIPGTVAAWAPTGAPNVLEKDLGHRPVIRPEEEMLFAAVLCSPLGAIQVRGVNLAREISYGFQLAGQSTMPRQVPLDSLSTGGLWCPSLFYLSNRVADLL